MDRRLGCEHPLMLQYCPLYRHILYTYYRAEVRGKTQTCKYVLSGAHGWMSGGAHGAFLCGWNEYDAVIAIKDLYYTYMFAS